MFSFLFFYYLVSCYVMLSLLLSSSLLLSFLLLFSFLLLLPRLSPLSFSTIPPFAYACSLPHTTPPLSPDRLPLRLSPSPTPLPLPTIHPPSIHLPYPYAYRKSEQHRSERYHIPSFTNSTTKQAFSSANFTYENYNSHNLFQLLLRFNDRVCRLFRLMYPAHFLQRCANRVALYLLNSDRGFP
jgi:hypothetical protein